ncbi:MAG: hypothetical protein HY791_03800 [Deltaproteobacteria bacterium]|nr:hypothetical protein [Deltaproteobacteria bacterium]
MRGTAFALSLLLQQSTAWGYSDGTVFARDPSAETSGGGGGLFFTGSPRQHGLECGSCHVDGPVGREGLRLSALLEGEPAALFTRGYAPGRVYEVEVAFEANSLTPMGGCESHEDEPCDISSFALEILDREGRPAGSFCPVEPKVSSVSEPCGACSSPRRGGSMVEADCSVVLGDAFDMSTLTWRNGQTAYSFFWTAPADDLGILTTYVSAVDGRGRAAEGAEVTSFEGDGVTTLRVDLGSPSEPTSESCQSIGPPGLLGALISLAILVLRRRQ